MKNKKEKIIAILLVVGLIVVTGTISYAAFRFSGIGSKVNTITTGAITMSYTESSNVLSMSGALPTTDTTGKGRLNPGEYFDFTVSSSITGDTNINYEIAVEELAGSTMDGDYIKFYLTKLGTDGSEQGIFGPSTYSAESAANTYTGRPANMMSLYTSSMTSSETTTYRLRMYVSEEYNPQGDGGNLTYKARVNVYGLAGDKIENEPVALEAGLYDEEGNMTMSWQDLINSGLITVSEQVLVDGWEVDGYKLIISDSVTSIGDSAFGDCSSLESVIIPDSVISIGNGSFGHCYNLKSISIPNSVTSIGGSAFSGCAFTSIIIPSSVSSIGFEAFTNCTNLTAIYYSGTATGAPWDAPNATVIAE